MTVAMPSRPAVSSANVITGITSMAAIMRGSTSMVIGSRPIVTSASTSSFTFMVPISAAKAEPVRPARITEASNGPSSRSRLIATRLATKMSAPNRRIGTADWNARISPIR